MTRRLVSCGRSRNDGVVRACPCWDVKGSAALLLVRWSANINGTIGGGLPGGWMKHALPHACSTVMLSIRDSVSSPRHTAFCYKCRIIPPPQQACVWSISYKSRSPPVPVPLTIQLRSPTSISKPLSSVFDSSPTPFTSPLLRSWARAGPGPGLLSSVAPRYLRYHLPLYPFSHPSAPDPTHICMQRGFPVLTCCKSWQFWFRSFLLALGKCHCLCIVQSSSCKIVSVSVFSLLSTAFMFVIGTQKVENNGFFSRCVRCIRTAPTIRFYYLVGWMLDLGTVSLDFKRSDSSKS